MPRYKVEVPVYAMLEADDSDSAYELFTDRVEVVGFDMTDDNTEISTRFRVTGGLGTTKVTLLDEPEEEE